MARLGLGNEWECRFANDIDEKKARSYRAYWQTPDVMRVQDVRELAPADLPGRPDLVWASFPCQDLSLAGAGAGLAGHRSGSFWPFWRLMTHLGEERRAPAVIVLENVSGALASHGGRDFAAIGDALVSAGYRFGAVIIDAVHFVPQSRPRLFIVAARRDVHIPSQLVRTIPDPAWHNQALVNAYRVLSPEAQCAWVWFNLPAPAPRRTDFADIIEDDPGGVSWNSREQTERLIAMMSETNRDKLRAAQAAGGRVVGGIYRRTRMDENGRKAQRAEVRFDGTAGCLRTATGGSSRQTVIIVDGSDVRSRLLSPREAARLMGLPEDYPLPSKYNEAYDLAGDGLVVPVVSYLEAHILRPILCEHAGAADVIGGGSAHA
jgi:DNA (cytosine-5)-methyltransferase 1